MLDRLPIGDSVVDDTIVYVLDSDLNPVGDKEIGELYVSGANLAAGYVNGRNPERFVDNPLVTDPINSKMYRTGDFVSVQNGAIYYEGRTDSQIKIRGQRIDFSEVEKNLMSLDYIEKGVVLCYHAGEIDQALVAFCVVSSKEGKSSEFNTKIRSQIENDLKYKLASKLSLWIRFLYWLMVKSIDKHC